MSTKTGPDDRRKFYERHLQGETYTEIAEATGVSVGCVRYWCRRLRNGGSCLSHYHRPARGILVRFDPLVRYWILRLRHKHKRWGPGRIRYHVAQIPSIQWRRLPLPGVAEIGRYLHQWPRLRRRLRPVRITHARPVPPLCVHQRWLLDFKLGIRLANGTQVNLHTLQDPVAEAAIAVRVTAAGRVGRKPRRVTLRQLQDTVRAGVGRWHTWPQELGTDNEPVFVGDTSDPWPGLFTLWLVGLDIRHVTSRPGRPTDNAEVERYHQTICNYAVVGNEEQDCAGLQQLLERALEELVFALPSQAQGCHGLPPAVAHPELLQPAHLSLPEHEWLRFDLARVDAYLAARAWQRLVSSTGQVSIGGQHQYYSVGRAYAGRQVSVRFDPADRSFIFSDTQPPYPEIRRQPARNLGKESITGLTDPDRCSFPQQFALFDFADKG